MKWIFIQIILGSFVSGLDAGKIYQTWPLMDKNYFPDDIMVKNLKAFQKDISIKSNKSLLKKLVQTKKVRAKIIKLKQDINKPDFGRN